tara:strand:+ start:6523 stop:7428 length:906 start_codon:yes stop_codon:yes gene_type:complete
MARLRAYRRSGTTTLFKFKSPWAQRDFIGILQKANITPDSVTRREVQVTFFPTERQHYSKLNIFTTFRSENDAVRLIVEYIEKKNDEINNKKDRRQEKVKKHEKELEEERKKIEEENKRAAKEPWTKEQMELIPGTRPKGRDISNKPRNIDNSPRFLLDEFPRTTTPPGELTDAWNLVDDPQLPHFRTSPSTSNVSMEVEIISENVQEEERVISKLESVGIPFRKKGISVIASIIDIRSQGIFTPQDAEERIQKIIEEEKQEGQVPRTIAELRDAERKMGKIGEFKQTTKYGDIEPTSPEE